MLWHSSVSRREADNTSGEDQEIWHSLAFSSRLVESPWYRFFPPKLSWSVVWSKYCRDQYYEDGSTFLIRSLEKPWPPRAGCNSILLLLLAVHVPLLCYIVCLISYKKSVYGYLSFLCIKNRSAFSCLHRCSQENAGWPSECCIESWMSCVWNAFTAGLVCPGAVSLPRSSLRTVTEYELGWN